MTNSFKQQFVNKVHNLMETRSRKKQANGLTGLSNVGNTCYLNSFAQVLSHTYEFNEFLDKKTYEIRLNRRPESLLLIEWDKLRQLMWSQDCTIAPWGFVKSVQRVSKLKEIDLFSGFAQNDIQEFLMFMIDGFHMSIARPVDMTISGTAKNDKDLMAKECYTMMSNMYAKDYSEIVSIFCGIHVSRIQNISTGNNLSVRAEPFFLLSLPIPGGSNTVSLEACMEEYTKRERLENENAWFNEKTNKKEDVDKDLVFWSLPDILIIHLKRWNYNGRKDQRLVECNLDVLDLCKYVHGYNKSSYMYSLYGICNHTGGTLGGHYTANIKVNNTKWYNFNDTSIREIELDKVVTPQAYCLFFRKIK